ncbi:hypothetical protein V7111_26230, partial [Neobacillus niacini]|uniref:hypothetical protein n=1 Tax=Neobacillus niacini TaxID=86668 RepID=UPI0030016785
MNEQKIEVYSRKQIVPAFIALTVMVVGLFYAMNALQPLLLTNHYLFDFGELLSGSAEGSLFYRIMWFFIDITEVNFIGSVPASILMCIMAFVAVYLKRKSSKANGTSVDRSVKIFSGVFLSMVLSLILSQLLFGSMFSNGFILTFPVILSTQAFVIFYGPSSTKIITCTLVCTPVTFIVCQFLMVKFVSPLGLPLFLAVAVGLLVAIPICGEIFRMMPWMKKEDPTPKLEASNQMQFPAAVTMKSETRFYINRIFGDISELTMWGGPLATIGMYIGAIISWILNPMHPTFSLGQFPLIMCAQILTAALSILIYYPIWKKNGWAWTFAGPLFVSAIFVTYSLSPLLILATIIIGAV